MSNDTANQGYIDMICPIRKCKFKRRFTETEQTLENQAITTERREEYLRLAHDAGQHDATNSR